MKGEPVEEDSGEDEEADNDDNYFSNGNSAVRDGELTEGDLVKYSTDVEPQMPILDSDGEADTDDTSNLRQVEVKILDFNWVFIADNASRFLKILAETENDGIFTSRQVRVLIEFLWTGYFDAIKYVLLYPYLLYFVTYSYLVLYLSKEHGHDEVFKFYAEVTCMVLAGKMWVHFLLLEVIQMSMSKFISKWSYFSDFWNIIDVV